MNDVAATLGIVQLPYLDGILAQRREVAAYYDTALEGVPGVRLIKWPKDRVSAYWLYTLFVERRTEFMAAMKSKHYRYSSSSSLRGRMAGGRARKDAAPEPTDASS
jgi:dTDP-4-amino-4,6-dideoxygalactose transaminase